MPSWWEGLAAAFKRQGIPEVPSRLFLEGDFNEGIGRPNLLFGQTCGFPLTHEFKGMLQVISTPTYNSPHTKGAKYCSVILAHEDSGIARYEDAEGKRVAVSSYNSFSGYVALKSVFAPFVRESPFFGSIVITGSQWNSIVTLSKKQAEICACDCISFELARRAKPSMTDRLRIIGTSPLAPGLPYVTSSSTSLDVVERLYAGLLEALEDPSLTAVRADLLINGSVPTTIDDYRPISELVHSLDEQGAEKLFPGPEFSH